MSGPVSVAEFLGACLRAVGATRTFGRPLPGLAHVSVTDPALARLLADADGRIGPGPGVAWSADGHLRITSQPGVAPPLHAIDGVDELAAAVATWSVGAVHSAREYRVDLDLEAPVPEGAEPFSLDVEPERFSLSPDLADLPTAVLVGPGVVRHGAADALAAFAAHAGLAVLNTWGAKGVFRWDSPFHAGTGGLQARDFELAGFGDVDLVIAIGVDEDEAPRALWEQAQALECDAASLATLVARWPDPERAPQRSELYSRLAEALGPLYRSDDVPLRPARAAGDMAEVLPAGGLVAADAGEVGLWVARAFPTSEVGSVVVPATRCPGFAAAAALVASLDERPALAVTAAPRDEPTETILALAEALGQGLVLAEWGAEPGWSSAGDHRPALVGALHGASGGSIEVVPVPVDLTWTSTLVDVAGPVVAWGGLDGRGPTG